MALQHTEFQLDQDVTIHVLHHDDRNDSMESAIEVQLKKDTIRNHHDVKDAIKRALGDNESRPVERVWQAVKADDGSIVRNLNVADMSTGQFKESIRGSRTNNGVLFLWYDQNTSPPTSPRSGSPEEGWLPIKFTFHASPLFLFYFHTFCTF